MLDILIPVFNKVTMTLSCMDSLKLLDPTTHKIYICDNGSMDATANRVAAKIKDENLTNFTFMKFEKNRGFAKACNAMFKESTSDMVMFLNNDITISNAQDISKTWTSKITDKLLEAQNNDVDLILSPTGGFVKRDGSFVLETEDVNQIWNYLSGWMLCSNRKTFSKFASYQSNSRPFSEDTFCFFEDTWLSFMAKEHGMTLEMCPIFGVKHIGHQTAKTLDLNKLYLDAKKIFVKKMEKYKFEHVSFDMSKFKKPNIA